MTRIFSCTLLSTLLLLLGTNALCSTFDERLWERYAEINPPSVTMKDGLAAVYLEPQQLGDLTAGAPFADLRVVSDRKEEVPWQIVAKRPERREEEIPARISNLSITGKNETWLELLPDKAGARANAVEIITPDGDFSRQVQVLGSPDGNSWNTLLKNGVIFDINRGEKLRRTRITFPQTDFRHLALRIDNGDAQPLRVSGVKVIRENYSQGETYAIKGTIVRTEANPARRENSLIVRMDTVFPLDRLEIAASDRNFQRCVDVQIKRGTGDWGLWARGIIFNFDTATMKEARTAIDMPVVAAREFRLVFRNLDSPPLKVINVAGKGYRRMLVFKEQPERKLYLFWGNPQAVQPMYDLAGLMAKQKPEELPIAFLGKPRQNTGFAGKNARLPFTERYRYTLYAVVTLAIALLIFLQYRVIKRMK